MKRDIFQAAICLEPLTFGKNGQKKVAMDWRKAGFLIVFGIPAAGCVEEAACPDCYAVTHAIDDDYSCAHAKAEAISYKTIEFIEQAERLCPGLRWIGDLEATYSSWDGSDHQVPVPYPADVLNDGFVDTSNLRVLLNNKTPADVDAILTDLFGSPELPNSVPTIVDPNVLDNDPLKNFLPAHLLETVAVDSYQSAVDYPQSGLYMTTWHNVYTPAGSPSHVVILIQGHDNELLAKEIVYFLEQGAAVIHRGMPGFLDEHFIGYAGHQYVGSHDGLYALESDTFNPMALFLEPNIQAVNLASSLFPEAEIELVGLSGGALMALLTQAFDDRIDVSVSVSGWKPFFLRYRTGLLGFEGDYEQNTSRFYKHHSIGFLDLVDLATRHGKRHYQVWVRGDTSAFGGDGYLLYADQLSEITDGRFQLILDETSVGHRIELDHLESVEKAERIRSLASTPN